MVSENMNWDPLAAVSGIYCIRCAVNGRCYVGQSQDACKRLLLHRQLLDLGLHDNSELQEAWRLHGAAAFEASIVERVPLDRLRERELYWIDQLSAIRLHGFNGWPAGWE
jgi:group I intron endonuclease